MFVRLAVCARVRKLGCLLIFAWLRRSKMCENLCKSCKCAERRQTRFIRRWAARFIYRACLPADSKVFRWVSLHRATCKCRPMCQVDGLKVFPMFKVFSDDQSFSLKNFLPMCSHRWCSHWRIFCESDSILSRHPIAAWLPILRRPEVSLWSFVVVIYGDFLKSFTWNSRTVLIASESWDDS